MSRPNYLNETGPYDTRAEAAGALMPRAAHALAAQARDHVESKEAAVNVTYDMLTAACQAGDVDLGRFDAEALRWIAEHADVEVAQALLGMVFRVGKADAGAVQRLVAYRNDVVSQRDRTRNMLADLVAGVGQALEQPELHEVESGALLDLDRLLTDARTVLASLPPRVQLGDLQPGDELAGPGSSLLLDLRPFIATKPAVAGDTVTLNLTVDVHITADGPTVGFAGPAGKVTLT